MPIVPKHLEQSAPTAAKNKKLPAVRIVLQLLLDHQGQAVEAFAHIRVAGRQPETGSSPPLALNQHRDCRRQRGGIDRARDPKPRPARKLDLDHTGRGDGPDSRQARFLSRIGRVPRYVSARYRSGSDLGHSEQ